MKANVKAINGSVLHEIELPPVFNEEFRPDLIKRAVLSYQSEQYQPYGANPYAGMRTSAEGWGSKRGESKIPRIKNGSRGAKVPQTKGGHPAHAPKVEKLLVEKINKKEKAKAIRSAIAATVNRDLVFARGHKFEGDAAIIVEDAFETLTKTADVMKTLIALGLGADIERAKKSRNIRAGRGKIRGRKYKQAKSVLIVTSSPGFTAGANIAGVDVMPVTFLNANVLAPGAHAGRLTVWIETAVKMLWGSK
ncbi:MAG TPA: 50S ribosomal protein L4 [Methanocorpusculum sp.]|nr:50S ribosomal protein L4 [Methanocorpusculum sp.]HJJ92372.1 50S ribosomal protein L4 [Methanocorpusculum sp.]